MKKILSLTIMVMLIITFSLNAFAQESLTMEQIEEKIQELGKLLNDYTDNEERKEIFDQISDLDRQLQEIRENGYLYRFIPNPDSDESLPIENPKTPDEYIQEIARLKAELEQCNYDVEESYRLLQNVLNGGKNLFPLSHYEENYNNAVIEQSRIKARLEQLTIEFEQLLKNEVSKIEAEISLNPLDKNLYNKAGEIYNQFNIPGMKLFIDGYRVSLSVDPLIENGRTLVPLRGVCEKLGAEVIWDASIKTIKIIKNKTITMTLGKNTSTIDNVNVNLDVPPKLIGSSTYIPLRFVAENLNCEVSYDGNYSIITINSK